MVSETIQMNSQDLIMLPTGNTLIKETQFNSLVYPLPDTPLKKVDDVIYFYKDVQTQLVEIF